MKLFLAINLVEKPLLPETAKFILETNSKIIDFSCGKLVSISNFNTFLLHFRKSNSERFFRKRKKKHLQFRLRTENSPGSETKSGKIKIKLSNSSVKSKSVDRQLLSCEIAFEIFLFSTLFLKAKKRFVETIMI